jgi:hypothetical protein
MLCCRRIPLAKANLLGSSIVPPLPQTSFLQKALVQRLSQLNPLHQRYITTSPPKPPLATRIVSSLPARAKPYAYLARLDKPVGSWLLYWPCGLSPLTHPPHTADVCSMEYNPRRSTRTNSPSTTVLYVGTLWCRRCSNAWRRMYHQ